MTKSFDEWFENEMPNSHKKVGKEKIETVIYSCAESAWDFKQAEVDGLQLKLSEDSRVLHNVIDIERRKCEKLQKRIDEAMKYVSESPLKDVSRRAMINFMDILKGDSHES